MSVARVRILRLVVASACLLLAGSSSLALVAWLCPHVHDEIVADE